MERNVTMADHEHGSKKLDVAASATIYGDAEDEFGDGAAYDDGTAYAAIRGGGKPTPACAICGSRDHRKSEHPGPCPLARAPPHGKSCPGNPLLGVPHNDATSQFGQCPFGYFPPAQPYGGRAPARGARDARDAPRPPSGAPRRPQASLEASEHEPPTADPVEVTYSARSVPSPPAPPNRPCSASSA